MKNFLPGFFLILLIAQISLAQDNCISSDEMQLYKLVNEYRKKHKLSAIPLSKSLTYVAQQHCQDLSKNKPDQGDCNAHSWSDKGKWSACCYTPDHKQAQCMWDKPKELTKYPDYGFEIAFGDSDPMYDGFIATPQNSLEAWQKSPGHNSVILNLNKWKGQDWKAMGVGMYKGFAVIWFGKTEDPAGQPVLCK